MLFPLTSDMSEAPGLPFSPCPKKKENTPSLQSETASVSGDNSLAAQTTLTVLQGRPWQWDKQAQTPRLQAFPWQMQMVLQY